MDKNEIEYKVKSAIFGLVIGDALGVPVEFKSRYELRRNPVTDMRSSGTYNLPAGTWSDDTSMTLAELDVLCDGIDYVKIMEAFCEWKDNGKYSATGKCFDIGIVTREALCKFQNGTSPLECGGVNERDNGNGSLMRIIPFVLFYNFSLNDTSLQCGEPDNYDRQAVLKREIYKASALTHGHMRSMAGCFIYAHILSSLLNSDYALLRREERSADKNARRKRRLEFIKGNLDEIKKFYCTYSGNPEEKEEFSAYERIFRPDFADLSEDSIKSGGYVVHSLEAALWCVLNTDSYEECVLKAVNLGDDTDTTAAIAGGLAGAMYGYDSLPEKWLSVLKQRDMIEKICRNFAGSAAKKYLSNQI